MEPIKKVAVITSGGDAPGINSALFGMISKNTDIEICGFNGGYDGILNSEPIYFKDINLRQANVSGNYILQTSRSTAPRTEEGRAKIIKRLKSLGINTLIVCGGDGSFKAAELLTEQGMPCLGIPLTIDNDIYGTECTIGYNTAIKRVTDVLYSLHQTAHNMPGRIFMVEVFGGNSGHIALASVLAGGADIAIIPEMTRRPEDIVNRINEILKSKNDYVIIVCSESVYDTRDYIPGDQGISLQIGKKIEELTGMRVRHSVLGYFQRGGDPDPADSLLALQMGSFAIESIKNGKSGYMVGWDRGRCVLVPLFKVVSNRKELDNNLLKIALEKGMIIGKKIK
ncbi:ATP-dependent 6-phosphofructokinase [Thermoanaerobacterium sp. CMT5567-10]|uniref:6-phosphofructokinase n=1 Tax=Thermoanaerobacterium sp. CMT5567-10 TaxID=3061989 RepID=UPI0026E09C6B|nr:ATP-dependent 6-phosphofructokinase [Thermoanaerobacterium sp. CMT5567-10]WKV10176.1 ATP-dependent 6-phosphofructokinase [Thermoanaerobacterium sp. CMT5567-10]